MPHIWLYLDRSDIVTERQQCLDEGKDIRDLETEFEAVAGLDLTDPASQPRAQTLLDATIALPVRSDFLYHEPSDLDGIRASCPQNAPRIDPSNVGRGDSLFERVHGAWLGRLCGCLLGKPVEGWRLGVMEGYLRALRAWPLDGYWPWTDDETIHRQFRKPHRQSWCRGGITSMPEDDDTNYTTTALAILLRHGPQFTPVDVANFWLSEIPILHTCTAERVAYRNFCLLIQPPHSASFRNPYREWIGAQIRADLWGYVCPGNPELAAEFAWRDASISHVKNGIYGEMFVAAMLAAAYTTDDLVTVIEAGLGQIPERCRLAERVRTVMDWKHEGISYEEARARIHAYWDETTSHAWCHTISNAEIVVVGLLWGDHDYERSITFATMGAFDTDCNAATVGSIIGLMHGRSRLPAKWTDPLHDTLHTGVAGYHTVAISAIARDSMTAMERVAAGG